MPVSIKPDIVDIISQFISLKKIGSSYAGICPFHNTNTYDAFRVSPDLQRFKCFNCGAEGDVIEFIKLYHNTDFKGALEILRLDSVHIPKKQKKRHAKQRDSKLKKNRHGENTNKITILYEAIHFYKECLKESKDARAYLINRGILDEGLIKKLAVGYAPKKGLETYMIDKGFSRQDLLDAGLLKEGEYGLYEFFRECIVFPVYNRHSELVTITSRSINPEARLRHKHLKGSMGVFYNEHSIDNSHYFIITEGIFDCLSLLQEGFSALAVFGTGGLQPEMARLLKGKTVYLCFDKEINQAGQKGLERAVDILTDEEVEDIRVIELPYLEGKKLDINELFTGHYFTKEDFSELMVNARTWNIYQPVR